MPSALPWLVDNASRMTNLSSFMAAQPSREHQAAAAETVDEYASVNGDLFGTSFGTLDTKSERSRYYDVESDGTASLAHLDPDLTRGQLHKPLNILADSVFMLQMLDSVRLLLRLTLQTKVLGWSALLLRHCAVIAYTTTVYLTLCLQHLC